MERSLRDQEERITLEEVIIFPFVEKCFESKEKNVLL